MRQLPPSPEPADPAASGFSRRDFLKLGGAAMVAGLLPGLTGCAPSTPLRVGINPWPGFAFIQVAMDNGWIDTKQIRLQQFANYADSGKALLEKRVDAAGLTLDKVLQLRQHGLELTVVAILDVSLGADALMASPGLIALPDLKGRRIGIEQSALANLMLENSLRHARLKPAEVEVVGYSGDPVQAWRAQKLDAVITYEPYVSAFEQQGWLRLFDSHEIPDTIIDVLAVRSDRIDPLASLLKQLLAAHFRAQDQWKHNAGEYSYRLSGFLQTPPEQIPTLFRGLQLPDLEYNRHMLAPPRTELLAALKLTRQALPDEIAGAGSDPVFSAEFLPERID